MEKDEARDFLNTYYQKYDIAESLLKLVKSFHNSEFEKSKGLVSDFLLTVYVATTQSLIIELYKFFDKDHRSFTIQSLMDECEKQEEARYNKLKEDAEWYKKNLELKAKLGEKEDSYKNLFELFREEPNMVEKLRSLRNKFFAHNDKEFFLDPQALFEENSLAIKEYEEILGYILKVLNKTDLHFGTINIIARSFQNGYLAGDINSLIDYMKTYENQ